MPDPTRGRNAPEELLRRNDAMRASDPGFQWFPATPPRLAPYLYSHGELGNTAYQHGALFDFFPLEDAVQGAKTWASARGLRYSLSQTLTYSGLSGVVQGDTDLGNYNLDFYGKWAVFDGRADGLGAGWISAQIEYQAAVGASDSKQSVSSNIGSLTNPLDFHSSHYSWRVPEFAWQQSFDDGRVVALLGIINQTKALDANSYANTGRGQFVNSALVNSMVLPLPSYNFGLNLQWQPERAWYGMLGYSVGNAGAGDRPTKDFSWEKWSLQGELGFAPEDVGGLGPGVYRLQPFVASNGDVTRGGLAINFEQQLGRTSPFGWFGRAGFGATEVAGGAKAQVGTGFVMSAPLAYAGWVPRLTDDLLGIGFVWSQPSATSKTIYHENEYVLETFYTLRLTPAAVLQTDLQFIWNPAFNPDPGPSVVLQVQLVLKW